MDEKLCSVEGCSRKPQGKYCPMHRNRLYKYGVAGPITSIYEAHKGNLCYVKGCTKNRSSHDKFCHMHRNRLSRTGNLGTPEPIYNKKNKGEGHLTRDGYIMVYYPNNPLVKIMTQNRKAGRGYILEHRFVMAVHLGRPLHKGENVHHKNGVRNDNRIENLELWVKAQPVGQRPQDLVTYAEEVLKKYAPHKLKD